mmetsp:Transcript_13815/g.34713  ORF Transcript_13815/g.34713 Transcript_13815/m.34713 type:complete len:91 (+) Transcript_13815:208-480(+)
MQNFAGKIPPAWIRQKCIVRSDCAQDERMTNKNAIACLVGPKTPVVARFNDFANDSPTPDRVASFAFRCRTTQFERRRSEAPCFDSFGAA